MNETIHLSSFDNFPCSFFLIGEIKITPNARRNLTDDAIMIALSRHVHCDFGEVSWEHHNGNLAFIEETRGGVTSHYTSQSGFRFLIYTSMDQFEPHSLIASMQ